MFTCTVLFAVLTAIVGFVDASPIPMPAAKHSEGMMARYQGYRYGQPTFADGTPCWHTGKFGYLKDRSCSLLGVDLDIGLAKRHGGVPFANGGPCWDDDKFGSIDGAVCVVANVNTKRDYVAYPYGQPVWLDGTPCWQNTRFGYLKDRSCSFRENLDLDIGLDLLGSHRNDYYRYRDFVEGTPCWVDRRFGYIQNKQCAAIEINADLALIKRGGYAFDRHGRPVFDNGSPCYDNGRFGYFDNSLCIIDINLDTGIVKKSLVEPVWTNGTPCWKGGRFGHLKDRTCDLIDAELNVAVAKREYYPDLVEGGPCWNEDRFGHIEEGACIVDLDLDVDLAKRFVENEGLVGGLIGEPSYRFANSHPNNIAPPKPLLGLAGLKRNGLFHNAPSGSSVESAVKSVKGLVGHSVTKKSLLNGGHSGLYRTGYYDDDDVVAELAAAAEVGHGKPLGGLGLKRTLGGVGALTDGLSGMKGGKGGKKQGGLGGLTGLVG